MSEYTSWGIGVSALVLLTSIFFFSKSKKGSPTTTKSDAKKVKASIKKLSIAEQFELVVKEVEDRLKGTLEPGVQSYYDSYEGLKQEDRGYKLNYFQEELLKLLIKLDGIELSEVSDAEKKAEMKTRRKEVIKSIQTVTKGLDVFKKQHPELDD